MQKRIVRGLPGAEDIGDLAAGKHDCVVCPAGPPVLTDQIVQSPGRIHKTADAGVAASIPVKPSAATIIFLFIFITSLFL